MTTAIHDGSPWLILACLMVFAGVVIGLYTRSGSEISSHPYTKGGELGADPPPETTGSEELEPLLSPRRAGRRARRKQR